MAHNPVGFDRVPAATLAPNRQQFIGSLLVADNATAGRLRIPITRTERSEALLLVLGAAPASQAEGTVPGIGLFQINSDAPDSVAFLQCLTAGIPIETGAPPLFWPLPGWLTELIIDGRGIDADGVPIALRYFAQVYAVDRTVIQDIRGGA